MLAPAHRARLERLLGGPIIHAQTVAGGYTPAVRRICRTAHGSFFVKIGVTPLTATFLRREIGVYRRLAGSFLPRCLASDDQDDPPILVTEDLSACAWPPPWNARRVDAVCTQIEALHATPGDLEPYAQVFTHREANWEVVAQDPCPFLRLGLADERWLAASLPVLLDLEARCPTAGDSLCHWDLRSDNIALGNGRVLFVDWNLACLSNPRLDLGFWLPSLACEGGPPPEALLADAPEVAAWVAGFFASRAGLPSIPDAPAVRRVQQEQLSTALPWAVRALRLPPLSRASHL